MYLPAQIERHTMPLLLDTKLLITIDLFHEAMQLCPWSVSAEVTQEDLYFPSVSGKLKLRKHDGDPHSLIYYARTVHDGQTTTAYEKIDLRSSSESMLFMLKKLQPTRRVSKVRATASDGETTINFDSISGVGCCIEIEIATEADTISHERKKIDLKNLISLLGLNAESVVHASNYDLVKVSENIRRIREVEGKLVMLETTAMPSQFPRPCVSVFSTGEFENRPTFVNLSTEEQAMEASESDNLLYWFHRDDLFVYATLMDILQSDEDKVIVHVPHMIADLGFYNLYSGLCA